MANVPCVAKESVIWASMTCVKPKGKHEMHGKILTYVPEENSPSVQEFDSMPSLAIFKGIVEGYLEAVPYFTCVKHDGKWHRCIAFCNEHGKLNALRVNWPATVAWYAAQRQQGIARLNDHLVGNVAVVLGDAEFMSEL